MAITTAHREKRTAQQLVQLIVEETMPKRSAPSVESIVHNVKVQRVTNPVHGAANWTGSFTIGPEKMSAAIEAVQARYDLE